ncbi:hypothetical protein ACFSUD_05510 [Sulfitobacter aestuarii]|uniref:DUF560 domain-containing protein n=1 Tax=Sulfitobacter aestuarii TaxID=2161676 RepID=A0ABW5TZR8_9RHOB
MIPARLRLLPLIAALGGLLLSSGAGLAETVLSVAQMRDAAGQSLKAGHPAQAATLAAALLARDGNDLNALLIRSRALRDLDRTGEARALLRRAWRLAQTDEDKYATALITAQVLATAGKRTRAQLWLRRAVQHAPNARLAARAKRDFTYVKQRNPWQTHLSFTLAPNSNINNGSARDRSELNYLASQIIFGQPVEYALSGSARALSGLEIGGKVQTRYRFAQTSATAHDAKLSVSYRSFLLGDSSKKQAPGVAGRDFAFGNLSLGYGYRQINLSRLGEFTFDAEVGQSFYGGARYATYLRGDIGQSYRASRNRTHHVDLNLERQFGQATADQDSVGLSTSLTQRLDSGNSLYLGLRGDVTRSPNPDAEYREIELRSGYVLGKPVMGAALQFGLGAAFRDYPVSRHNVAGREDRRLFADVTATFGAIDYYGFNPTVTLSASTTDSNIGLFDTNRLGLNLGIRSAF